MTRNPVTTLIAALILLIVVGVGVLLALKLMDADVATVVIVIAMGLLSSLGFAVSADGVKLPKEKEKETE